MAKPNLITFVYLIMIQLESWLSASYSATKTQQREPDSFERFQCYHNYLLLRLALAIYPQNVLWCSLQLPNPRHYLRVHGAIPFTDKLICAGAEKAVCYALGVCSPSSY